MPAGHVTPGRVVSLLVMPPVVLGVACAWWAADAAAFAYRLWRDLRTTAPEYVLQQRRPR